MHAPNIAAAQRFLDLARKVPNPTVAALVRCLDALAISYHDTPPGSPDEKAEDPPGSPIAYDEIGARFPDLGYYGVTNPADVPGEVLVGDAIDDIADIARDLEEVLWRFEHIGLEDAHWHFRLLFEVHWGAHLRDLARYLHTKQFA